VATEKEQNELENQDVGGEVGTTGESLEEVVEDAVDGDAPVSVEQLQAQLEETQQQLGEAKDQMLRAVAEAQNARRRADKDISNARLFALESFSRDLLPVIDNLERATDSASADDAAASALSEGVELTLKNFQDVLKRHHLEQIDPLSEPFDPEFHEAISMVENKDVEPNTVINVVQKGYTLNGRLLRAAMVVVSR
jgi:molecular chaperone GrpE